MSDFYDCKKSLFIAQSSADILLKKEIVIDNNLPANVVIGDAVLFQELDNEVVLLNMANQQYYGLNDVGAQMWKCLLESETVAAATEQLRDSYDVERDVLRADIERLVRDLLAAGLLKVR